MVFRIFKEIFYAAASGKSGGLLSHWSETRTRKIPSASETTTMSLCPKVPMVLYGSL